MFSGMIIFILLCLPFTVVQSFGYKNYKRVGHIFQRGKYVRDAIFMSCLIKRCGDTLASQPLCVGDMVEHGLNNALSPAIAVCSKVSIIPAALLLN